jgi:Tfp pilus assembly protein PilF
VDPTNEKAKIGIGLVNLERGETAAADAMLVKAAAEPGAGRDLFYTVGEVKLKKSEPDVAAEWFEKASAADPAWGKPLYQLGLIAMQKGDAQRASSLMTRVLTVDPISPEAALAKAALNQLNK